MGRFEFTCKKCGNKISTDILPSNGICKNCRNQNHNYRLAKSCDTCINSVYDATDDLMCKLLYKPIDGHYVCDNYRGNGR